MKEAKSGQHAPSLPVAGESIGSKDGVHQTFSNCETGNLTNATLPGPIDPRVVDVRDTEGLNKKRVELIDEGTIGNVATLSAGEIAKDRKEYEVKDVRIVRVEKKITFSTPNSNWGGPLGKQEPASSDGIMQGVDDLEAADDAPDQSPFNFACAFGFTGRFEAPPAPPRTRSAFLTTMECEIVKIGVLQSGMQVYQGEINSRKYHTFSTRFLVDQNTAIIMTLSQLDEIIRYIKRTQQKVQAIPDGDGMMDEKALMEFQQAQSWVARTRAILVHSHVFYKINFVLPGQKLH